MNILHVTAQPAALNTQTEAHLMWIAAAQGLRLTSAACAEQAICLQTDSRAGCRWLSRVRKLDAWRPGSCRGLAAAARGAHWLLHVLMAMVRALSIVRAVYIEKRGCLFRKIAPCVRCATQQVDMVLHRL